MWTKANDTFNKSNKIYDALHMLRRKEKERGIMKVKKNEQIKQNANKQRSLHMDVLSLSVFLSFGMENSAGDLNYGTLNGYAQNTD